MCFFEKRTVSRAFQDKITDLKEKLVEKDVGILVNNVGMTENTFGWFSDLGNVSMDKDELNRDQILLTEKEHCDDLIKIFGQICLEKCRSARDDVLIEFQHAANQLAMCDQIADTPARHTHVL